MDKLLVGELKEFIKDIPDNAEVRISSIYNTSTESSYHVSASDISFCDDAECQFLILEPSEIEISDNA